MTASYLYKPVLKPVEGDRVAIHENCDHGNQCILCVAITFILCVNLKCWMLIIYVAVFGNDVGAVSHEVVVTSIKCAVMWVTHNQTGTHWSIRCILGIEFYVILLTIVSLTWDTAAGRKF